MYILFYFFKKFIHQGVLHYGFREEMIGFTYYKRMPLILSATKDFMNTVH